MKTIFDHSAQQEVITRIRKLNNSNKAEWGVMNVYQMICHCTLWDEMVFGEKKYRQGLIGLLFGKFLLKSALKDRPMRKNNPTLSNLVIQTPGGDVEEAKQKWIASVQRYAHYSRPDNTFIHPYFGKMTNEQIGLHTYKHIDHHLKQFGC